VREDYSESGNARDYFTHDQARSRAYRWGEDGLGGISDAAWDSNPTAECASSAGPGTLETASGG
jgi:hypothetical protein